MSGAVVPQAQSEALTKRERRQLRLLDRRVMSGKATRSEVLRAIDLKRKRAGQ